ncbi:MAG TPA: hypothetical protein VJT31_10895 [Rugosimonospora sp.]|nr:hypothetical protein [Rugosimonospora sp.]
MVGPRTVDAHPATEPSQNPFGSDRQLALDLFDALGATQKTLHANLGGHAGTPWFEVDEGNRFFARHLT